VRRFTVLQVLLKDLAQNGRTAELNLTKKR
jgi:hypothetical protein